MDHREAGEYWNGNARAWSELARLGYDVYRNHFNAPAFLEMLPDVTGLRGLDIGCGEGYNTRGFARRGGMMTAIDISEVFIEHARETEREEPLGIDYQVASGVELPFGDATFDFATATMCLMDIPEVDLALGEAYRVLKPGGFFQFSITHPCFDTPHRKNLRGSDGKTYAIEVGRYYEETNGRVDEWIFGAAPAEVRDRHPKFKVPYFHRTLSEWMNLIAASGFRVERMEEPRPADEVIEKYPYLQDATVVSYFLQVRLRVPAPQ